MTAETVDSGFNGLYSVAEAARYLRATTAAHAGTQTAGQVAVSDEDQLRPQGLLRWIRKGLALPALAGQPGRDVLMTFEDLITLRLIVILRRAGYSLQHVRRVEDFMREMTGDPRPFATRDLWRAQYWKELYGELDGRLMSATKQGQLAFEFVMQELRRVMDLEQLEFDEAGIAENGAPTLM